MGVSFKGFATKAEEQIVLSSLILTYRKWMHDFKIYFNSEEFLDVLINRKPSDNIIDIYSTTFGTLCIMSDQLFEILSKYDLSENFDFTYFDISDTSMSYRFALFGNGVEKKCMNIWDNGRSKDIAGDNFLNITNDEDIFLNVFPRAINEYLPEPFNDIDLSSKITRYRLIPNPKV